MKTVYIAPHATYLLAADGTLLAIGEKAPTESPRVVPATRGDGTPWLLAKPGQLLGPWLLYLQCMGTALATLPERAAYSLLWPGERIRLRRWVPRGTCGWPAQYQSFDQEVTL